MAAIMMNLIINKTKKNYLSIIHMYNTSMYMDREFCSHPYSTLQTVVTCNYMYCMYMYIPYGMHGKSASPEQSIIRL